jgi:hypothetical protein
MYDQKFTMRYFFFLAVILFTACNSNEDTSKQTANGTDKRAKAPEPIVASNCYMGTNNRDTVLLNLTTIDKKIAGNLQYNFFEKDKNNGTFSGEMHGDTLLADYVFVAEGRTSTRQIIFLKKGNELVEGYAAMEEKENKVVFKNINTVDFSRGIVLKQVTCR